VSSLSCSLLGFFKCRSRSRFEMEINDLVFSKSPAARAAGVSGKTHDANDMKKNFDKKDYI